MDKEAFLRQLESSAANNNKNLFAKSIYILPADVIVGFTKEEFSRIIYITHQFSSPKMDKLSNFLEIKGLFFLKNALKEVDELNNCLLSKFYYSLYVSISENNIEDVKRVLVKNAVACGKLAEMGIDSRENIETAIRLCGDARKIFSKTSVDYALALMNESNARKILAEMDIDNRENLETAISLCGDARKIFSKTSVDYAYALGKEANARQRLAEIGINSRENFETAVSLYGNSRQILFKANVPYALTLMNEGNARQRLAEMGINSRENFETAVSLCDNAKKILSKKSADYAFVLINEGNARQRLAEMGINSRENLETAVTLYGDARDILSKKSADYALALVNESNARQTLAKTGIDSRKNLETAVTLCSNARQILSKTSVDYARALVNEGNTRQTLAEMGIDSEENLKTAVSLYSNARQILSKKSADYAGMLINEGNARRTLAEMGINIKENLETAIILYNDAKDILSKKSEFYARALINEGNARQTLAEMGIDSRKNLETAIRLCVNARRNLSKTSADYARSLINEGNARQTLAEIGIDSRKNLETAIRLCVNARQNLSKTSADYALALMNEGNARQKLAEMGINSRVNIGTVVSLYRNARQNLSKTSADHARALGNEGTARQKIAEMGIDSEENLETAVRLYRDAQEILPKTSADYARMLMNEGSGRQILAEMNINSNDNFENSKKLYLKSISILEELRDGWSYSLALLNLNSLLKNHFYKTGDKKHLEEWEKNLGDIEEKINNRDIRYREILMARIHEIRASLLEFEGKSGINKASREYDKAYELSKDPFYKFMDEFCQARIDTISFCELVSNWKEIEKEDIFLDYYDYTVFECHLENALKSTVNEEDELKLAVEKLKEIRDRTQIKIIKDRVSAYIHLLQALVDCFNNDSYKEAAENVKEGCKIFSKHGDKQGQQMCEIFHNAVVKKRDPDAWQEIIRNREFSSNFYNLLCEYSDRKRADMESYKLSQIYQTVNRTEKIVDQLQETLNQEFAEIKDQIIIGFKGSDSEFREIKKMIISIQQDFEYLTQVSNKSSNEEEEAIKIFMVKMLEMIKNGDPEKLSLFLEDIIKNEHFLEEIIEKSKASEREKANAKSKLADLKKMPGILKEKMKSFSVDVTKEVIVSLTAGEIITLLTPVLSTAAFGVPIPSKVVEMLLEVMKDS